MRENRLRKLYLGQFDGRLSFSIGLRNGRNLRLNIADWHKKSVPRWTLRPIARVFLAEALHIDRGLSSLIMSIIDPITATPQYYED